MKRLSSILFFLLFSFYGWSQPHALNFSHVKLTRGLPANYITQGPRGYLWIGSDGLFQFNGVDLTYFFFDPKILNSLPNNTIKNMAFAKDGSCWIGTMNGISHFFPKNHRFENYLRPVSDDKNENGDNIVFVDDDGNVWAGNREGIARLDTKSRKFIYVPLAKYQKRHSKSEHFITVITQDKKDKNWLWLGSYNGLIHYRKSDDFARYYYFSDQLFPITKIFIDTTNDRFFVCTWGKGILQFFEKTGKFEKKLFENETNDGTTNIVTDICNQQLPNGDCRYYCCTPQGLWFFTLGKSVHSFLTPKEEKMVLPDKFSETGLHVYPHSIFKDRQGIIWLTTDEGLSYLLPNNQAFSPYQLKLGALNHLVKGTLPNHQPVFWISSWYANGLEYVQSPFKKVEHPTYFQNLHLSKESRQINQVLDADSALWVATMGGLYFYDKRTKKAHVYNTKSGLKNNQIISLCYDHKNRLLWLGTYANAWFYFDPIKKTLSDQQLPPASFVKGLVNVIFQDSHENIWLGLNDKLVKYDTKTQHYSVYRNILHQLTSFPGGNISSILEDSSRQIWIGTSNGLCKYNATTDDFSLWTKSDGLSSNEVNAMTTDSKGRIWVACSKGLNVLSPKSNQLKSYYNNDGLVNDAQLYDVIFADGNIIVGGDDQLTVVNTSKLKKNWTPPTVYINQLLLTQNGKLFYTESTSKISLKYYENYFSIHFDAINFINSDENRYKYQLIGVDEKPIDTGENHVASYADVAPGDYSFKVFASNNDGVWNEKGATIYLHIAPPFWRTYWFYGCMILLILLILYGLHCYRIYQLMKLEKLRNRISADLHDDMGSTLSSISIMSEMALHDVGNKQTMLEKIKENAIELMDKMSDIVWTIKPQNDSMEILFLRIKTFAASFFEAKEISYQISVEEASNHIHLDMEKRQHIYLILKEAVNNVAKHAQCTYAEVSISFHSGILTMLVCDDGIGIKNDSHQGNGLKNITSRCEKLGATFDIQSKPQFGTKLIFRLKI